MICLLYNFVPEFLRQIEAPGQNNWDPEISSQECCNAKHVPKKNFETVERPLFSNGQYTDAQSLFVKRVIAPLKYFKILRFVSENLYQHIDKLVHIVAFLCDRFGIFSQLIFTRS